VRCSPYGGAGACSRASILMFRVRPREVRPLHGIATDNSYDWSTETTDSGPGRMDALAFPPCHRQEQRRPLRPARQFSLWIQSAE
jgi:hypothetical protein